MAVKKVQIVEIVKVPNKFLIMKGDSILGHAKREFQVAEICKENNWRPEPVQEFGGWLKEMVDRLTPKPRKDTVAKPNKDTAAEDGEGVDDV